MFNFVKEIEVFALVTIEPKQTLLRHILFLLPTFYNLKSEIEIIDVTFTH